MNFGEKAYLALFSNMTGTIEDLTATRESMSREIHKLEAAKEIISKNIDGLIEAVFKIDNTIHHIKQAQTESSEYAARQGDAVEFAELIRQANMEPPHIAVVEDENPDKDSDKKE